MQQLISDRKAKGRAHGRMARCGHGISKVTLGRVTPEMGLPACRACGMWHLFPPYAKTQTYRGTVA
jgi:hypothetical protein